MAALALAVNPLGYPPNSRGLSLAAVGTILMLARFTDVITDPLMGELSDRWRTRFGRRKPWVFLGTPLMMTLSGLPMFNALFPRLDHDRATASRLGGRTLP